MFSALRDEHLAKNGHFGRYRISGLLVCSCFCTNNDLMIKKADLDSMLEQSEPPWPRIKRVILSSVVEETCSSACPHEHFSVCTCIRSTTTHFSFTKTTTLNYPAQRNRHDVYWFDFGVASSELGISCMAGAIVPNSQRRSVVTISAALRCASKVEP